ncbi:hypothetical protein GGI04_004037, partial [Coemansia thaxteri]
LYYRAKKDQTTESHGKLTEQATRQQEPSVGPKAQLPVVEGHLSGAVSPRQLILDKENADKYFEKSAADVYIAGLHKSDWSSEETWMRFSVLPTESRKYLRNIDINHTLARIRGTEKDVYMRGKSAPTSQKLNKMLSVLGAATRAGIKPDQYTYQEMIAINSSLLGFAHALEWLEKMLQSGIRPTIRPYRTILKGYSALPSEIENARRLWEELKSKIERGELAPSEPGEAVASIDIKSYTCMLTAECRAGNFALALRLLDEMESAGIRPDITVRNVVLDGIIRHKGLEAGLEEAKLMEQSGFALSGFTFTILLKAAISEGQTEEIERLLSASAAKGFLPSSTVVQTLPFDPLYVLDLLAKSSELDTIRVYNTLIKASMRRNNFNQALQLVAHMRSHRVKANVVTYGLLLDALNKAGQFAQARGMFKEAFEGGEVEPDLHIFSTMIDACGRNGDIETMFWFKGEMASYNLLPAEPIYNSILASLSRLRKSQLRLVMSTVNELVRCHPPVKPTTRTYNAIFAAFAAHTRTKKLSGGELRFLRTWYSNTRDKYYVVKDTYLYVLAINAFVGAGSLEDAMIVYDDMLRHSELDSTVLQEFTRKPKHMLELMNLSVESQKFGAVLGLWRSWQFLGLPLSEQAVGLVLFACDQLGHVAEAKSIVTGLLMPRRLGDTAAGKDENENPRVSVVTPVAADTSEQRPHRRPAIVLDLESTAPREAQMDSETAVPTAYNPGMVGEAALAIYIGVLLKHGMVDDILPVLELWRTSTPNSDMALLLSARSPQSSTFFADTKRELSEPTVSKILKLVWANKNSDASKITDQFLAFVDRHFPEAMPL